MGCYLMPGHMLTVLLVVGSTRDAHECSCLGRIIGRSGPEHGKQGLLQPLLCMSLPKLMWALGLPSEPFQNLKAWPGFQSHLCMTGSLQVPRILGLTLKTPKSVCVSSCALRGTQSPPCPCPPDRVLPDLVGLVVLCGARVVHHLTLSNVP